MKSFAGITLGNEKYPALTGVRALGAVVVFLDHFPVVADAHLTLNVMAFFYCLSGFLIFRIYYQQAQLSRHWISSYFINRFARIYPVYFLLLSLAVILQHEHRPWVLIKNYTLTHALFYPSDLIIQPSWSLTVEECFYFLAPLFMLLNRWRGFPAVVLAGGSLLAAALLIARLPIQLLHSAHFVLSTTFFGHFAEFFAGAFLALASMRLEARGAIAIGGYRWTSAGCVGVLLLILAMVFIYGHRPFHAGAIVLINNFLMPLPIAVLYLGLIRENTALSRALGGGMAALLGRSSYSFYLLHSLVIDYISIPLLLPHMASRLLCVLLTLIGAWMLSIALFVSFEEPVNLFLRRRLRVRQKWPGMQATSFE